MAVFGVDVDSAIWRQEIFKTRVVGIIATAFASLFCLFLIIVIEQARRGSYRVLQSENRYRGIFEGSPNGILLYDRNGMHVACNHWGMEMLGLTEAQLSERSFDQLWPKEYHQRVNLSMKETLKGQMISLESLYESTEDEKFVFYVVINPIYDEMHAIAHFVVIILPIYCSEELRVEDDACKGRS